MVGRLGKEVAPLLLQLRDAGVDLLHARHFLGGKECARAHETLVDFLRQALVLTLELRIFVIVNELDALEELLVEGYLVLKTREQRHHLVLGFGQHGSLVGIGKAEEDAANAVEQDTTLLESENGILESRLLLVVDDLLNVVALDLDGCLDGRKVIALLDATEIGRTEGQITLHQKRVLLTRTRRLGRYGDWGLQERGGQSDSKE